MSANTRRRSRLWRVLGHDVSENPLFIIDSSAHDRTWTDGEISSISLTRGTTTRGLSTSAGTVVVTGAAPQLVTDRAEAISVRLTTNGVAALNALGITTNDRTRWRFSGRVVGQTVTDTGPDAGQYSTSISVQDWPALLSQLDQGALIERSAPGLDKLVDSLFHRGNIPTTGTEQWGSTWHHVYFAAEDADSRIVSTSDVLRYLDEAGMLVRTTRDARLVIYSHDHVISIIDDWSTYWPETLLRAQVLKPVEWTQPSVITTALSYKKRTSTGVIINGSVTIGSPGHTLRAQTLDLTHLVEVGNGGLNAAIIAKARENAPSPFIVEKATIDLLALISRGRGTDLATVSQLLNAEHGEVVVLAHDWPDPVIGVSVIKTVTETITDRAWTLELELVPANRVSGRPVPTVYGRTWDSAYPAVRTWDGPPTATWDTVPQEA